MIVKEPTTLEKVELLLQNLLWDGTYDPMKILRLKASVNLTDERTVLIQGVNDTYDIVPAKEKRAEVRIQKKNLAKSPLSKNSRASQRIGNRIANTVMMIKLQDLKMIT